MTRNAMIVLVFLTIIVAGVILYFEYRVPSYHSVVTTKSIESSDRVDLVENFLHKARMVYLNKTCPRDVFTCGKPNVDSFTLMMIFNATVEGDFMIIDGIRYRYIVVRFYNGENNTSIFPKEITTPDGIHVEYIPGNETVTYTGGSLYTYRVQANNEECKLTFGYIGFYISSFSILGESRSCDNIWAVEIFLGKDNYLWLILVRKT